MIKEHWEIIGVNTLIFLLFESYSDGKLFEIGNHIFHIFPKSTISKATSTEP